MAKDMELTGNWNYPTAIRFGAGRISELPDACRVLGMERPLLVTDPGLAALPCSWAFTHSSDPCQRFCRNR